MGMLAFSPFPTSAPTFPQNPPLRHPPRPRTLSPGSRPPAFPRTKPHNSRALNDFSTAKPQKNRTPPRQSPHSGSIYFNTTTSSCFILDLHHMRRYFRLHPLLLGAAPSVLAHTTGLGSQTPSRLRQTLGPRHACQPSRLSPHASPDPATHRRLGQIAVAVAFPNP
jgi:hypothetical protein